jgi:hypothetical protein
MNTVQWWRWDCLGEYHGFLSQTLTPFPATRQMLDDAQIVRDGLGTLLMQCDMQDDGIAMLYSLPSIYISHYDGNNGYGDYKREHQHWFQLLHDSGLQFRYVTDRMLRLGQFDASRYKVMILPMAFAIGPHEAQIIRDFVRNGGTIIADVRPGLYDNHCKALDQGALDDVFGIVHQGRNNATFIDRIRVEGELNGQNLDMRWGNWHGKDVYPQMVVDPSVQLNGGQARGMGFYMHFWAVGSPAFIVNTFGKGRAILFNFSLQYAPADSFIRHTLAASGVQPQIILKTATGDPVPGVEITRWRNGGEELFALLGEYEGEVQVRLPQPSTVCDIKTHRSINAAHTFAATLRPNRASFFARLPESAESLVLQVRKNTIVPGQAVQARVSAPGASGKRAVRFNLYSPDGECVKWFHKTIILSAQPDEVIVPFALNDPRGEWKLEAIDLYTNKPATARIVLR